MRTYLPDFFTGIRILLSSYLMIFMLQYFGYDQKNESFPFITILTLIIYITDYLDGRIARRLQCCTRHGALLDIAADFYYILGQCIVFIYKGILPWYVLSCIVMEFMIFAISSKHLQIEDDRPLLFDEVGRITAMYYYCIPYLTMLIAFVKKEEYLRAVIGSCYVFTVLAIASRLTLVVKKRKMHLSMDRR